MLSFARMLSKVYDQLAQFEQKDMTTLNDLCTVPELLATCFEYIDSRQLTHTISRVCKQWNQVSKAENIWRELTFGELKWPKPESNTLFQVGHVLPQPPNISLKNQLQDQTITWQKFFKLLHAKSDLVAFRGSHTPKKAVTKILTKKYNLTLPDQTRDDGIDVSGTVTVLKDVPLHEALHFKATLRENHFESLTSIVCAEIQNMCTPQVTFDVSQENINELEESFKSKEGTNIGLYVLNDETHSFDAVIRVLRLAKNATYQEADRIAWRAHLSGESLVLETTNMTELFKAADTIAKIDLKCRLKVVGTDPMYIIENTYFKGQPTVTSPVEEIKEDEEYGVLLFNGNYDINQFAEDIRQALQLPDIHRAVHIALGVHVNGGAFVYRGEPEKARRIYNTLSQKLYNCIIKSIGEFQEMYEGEDEEEEEELDGEIEADDGDDDWEDMNEDDDQ